MPEKTFGEPLTYEQVKNMDFKNISSDEAENFVSADEDYLYFKYVKTKKVEVTQKISRGALAGNAAKPEKRENVALEPPCVRLGYEPGEEIHAG